MVREVITAPTSARKVSIEFLLNSTTPQNSFDCKRLAANLPPSTHRSAGVEQLLSAASLIGNASTNPSLLGKRSIHSATSSDTTSHADEMRLANRRSEISGTEVVQPVKTKRRKRKDTKCKECGRTFGDSSSMRKHYRVVHLKIKDFKCEECGKTFAEKSNRSKHYIAAHLNQRSHPCPDCDKVFNFTDGLRRHRNNVHLGLRPYPCEDCNTSYKQKTHLLKHRQSVHGIPLPPKRN